MKLFAPPFCGPEAICNIYKSGGYDTKSDVWAAGAIMYRMLIGENPPNTQVKFKDEKWKKFSPAAKDLC